jgi:hypothetical protein
MWKDRSLTKYGKSVEFLTREEVREIKNEIPLNISELEKRL